MIVLNEIKFGKSCLENKEDFENHYQALVAIGKYLYYECEEDLLSIEKSLKEYMNEIEPYKYNFKKKYWDELIEKIVSKLENWPPIKLDYIGITQNELDTIKKINDKRLQRLMFTMLCIAKYNVLTSQTKNTGWVNRPVKEVFDLANVRCKKTERYGLYSYLYADGLIEYPKKLTNLNQRVTFIDLEGEPVLKITDMRKLGMQYQEFCGQGKYSRCQECGLIIKKPKYSPKKYCYDCAKAIHIKKTWELEKSKKSGI